MSELSEAAVTVAVGSGAMGGSAVASGCGAEARARRMACALRICTGAFKAACNLDVRSVPVGPRDPDETLRPTASVAKSPAVGATVCRLGAAAERSLALPAPRLIPATCRTGRGCPAATPRLTPATRGIGRARPAAAHPAPCLFGNSPPADSALRRGGGRLSGINLPLGASSLMTPNCGARSSVYRTRLPEGIKPRPARLRALAPSRIGSESSWSANAAHRPRPS